MRPDKRALSLLLKQSTVDLMGDFYIKDCPEHQRSFSQWVDDIILSVLNERQVITEANKRKGV